MATATNPPSLQATGSPLRPLVIVAIAVTVLAWASAFIVIRGTASVFSPGALALARLVVGAVLLSLLVVGRRWVAPTLREWLLIAGFGVLWFGAYSVVLNAAEVTLDAGTTAMIVNIGPILIALGAGWILREGIPRWLAIGAGVAFVGVVLIGIATGGSDLGDGTGVLLALAAALTYAIGVLCQKPALRRLPAAQVTFMGCVIGAVVCLPFAGELAGDVQAASASGSLGAGIFGAVYLGAVPTALGFTAWGYALSRMPAGQLGISTYVVPAIAVVMGLLFFGEIPPALAIVGGIVCLAGVALSRRKSPSRG